MKYIKYYALKIIFIISAIVGTILSATNSSGFMSNASAFLYFTIQSNLWIAIVGIIEIIYSVKHTKYSHLFSIIKLMFTVSITLTGFVFCFILVPTIDNPWGIENVLTHVVVPISSIVDYFINSNLYSYKKNDYLYSLIPPFYYLIFSIIGFFCNFNYLDGNNYPYFFMNWNSPCKIFGFSKELPFMGVFYWIIILGLLFMSISYLYYFIVRKTNHGKN